MAEEIGLMSRVMTKRSGATSGVRVRGVTARSSRLERAAEVFRPVMLIGFSTWLGLLTANLELLIFWVRWRFVDQTALSSLQLNQHAAWMVPLSDALIFTSAGLGLALIVRLVRSRWAAACGVYALCFLSVYALMLTYRGLTSLACVALAAGIGYRICIPILVNPRVVKRIVLVSLPVFLGLTTVLWAMGPAREKISERNLPPARPSSPNVLFIVLDTVRAESLSLHGYPHQTSPFLAQLAARGVRFDQARSTAPWTLPSHASMFTGRWPHELSMRLDRPLDSSFPTLAEYLGANGYDTAGFVANTFFCSRWFGLSRGFVHYEDVAMDLDEVLRSSGLGRAIVRKFTPALNDRPTAYFERKDAATVNDEVLGWLARRPPDRPFFAFLNYYDAHDPYLTPEGEARQFGTGPRTGAEHEILRDWHRKSRAVVDPEVIRLARDSYDDCIAYLDRQLGRLFERLESMGLLNDTLVIVTSDHGEEFGEHGSFGHGQQLYSQELHVPLLIVAPGRVPAGQTVTAPVSLRDLPATVVDLLGIAGRSPFPGHSLAGRWVNGAGSTSVPGSPVVSEITDDDGKFREGPPSQAFVDQGMVYIRGGDGREELYDLVHDPAETKDLCGDASFRPALAHLRQLADSFSEAGRSRPLAAAAPQTR
jgi:arylsulfatase A-like enzyme